MKIENSNNGFSRKDFLRKLLVPLWLRPESAMWYAHMLYEARLLLGQQIEQPSLEFGCMDGVNSFLLLGGEFGLNFDVFREVRWDKQAHTRSTIRDDYFDTFRDEELAVDIATPPPSYFEVGLDWKEAHIHKAKRLNVFKELVLWDANKPLAMFNDASFATIWAPNIYWIDNLNEVLPEFNRILALNGKIITIAPDKTQLEYMWYRYAPHTNEKWLQDLDRGRYQNAQKHARSLDEWLKVFELANLSVVKHKKFIPSLVGQVYDIGLRPMFPVFMNMYEKLQKHSLQDWLDVKQHWINTIYDFLDPLCDNDWMDNMAMEKLWHIFELRSNKS